ncbi:hypothetical protein ACWD5Q_08720 [Streptomyces sp. NPDC002513]
MYVLSLAALLEEAAADVRNQTGNIRALNELLRPENVRRLREFARAYCFLAFHSRDIEVADYVRAGTLADDSGPDVLVLFTLDEPAPIAVPVGADSLRSWVDLDVGVHPSYRMVRALFNGRPTPPLPGLVVLDDLAEESEALYLPLGELDNERAVRQRLRRVLALIGHVSATAKPGKYLDDLGLELYRLGIEHVRTDRISAREWLLRAFDTTRANLGDIVTTIGLTGLTS